RSASSARRSAGRLCRCLRPAPRSTGSAPRSSASAPGCKAWASRAPLSASAARCSAPRASPLPPRMESPGARPGAPAVPRLEALVPALPEQARGGRAALRRGQRARPPRVAPPAARRVDAGAEVGDEPRVLGVEAPALLAAVRQAPLRLGQPREGAAPAHLDQQLAGRDLRLEPPDHRAVAPGAARRRRQPPDPALDLAERPDVLAA